MSEYRPGYIEGKRKLGVYVDEEVHKALRVRAAETGESMGDITERALRREFGMMEVNTKTCYACNGDYARGYWLPEADHIFVCEACATDADRAHGIYDDGSPGQEYVVINVLETGDDYTEQIDSRGMLLTGGTDAELIEAAIQAVTERWGSAYRVFRNEDGGACEITHYTGESCRQVAITVTSALIPWTELELTDRDNDPVTDEETIRTALDEFRRTGAIDGYFFARLGLPHEDEDDASTWGPASPEAVDWTGFDDV